MPVFEMSLTLKKDGVTVPNFPIQRRISVLESIDNDALFGSTGAVFDQFGLLSPLAIVVVQTLDEPVTVRLADQTDAGINLNAGGVLLVFDGNLAGVANTKIRNATAEGTNIHYLEAGY